MRLIQRPVETVAVTALIVGMLAGCSLLGGVSRDADGRVTESSDIQSTQLLAGDCFSFIGDGSDLSQVTVIPCADPHTHRVIGQGTLTTNQVDEAGSLQNAVSAACNESFTTFKTTLVEGLKTEQQFLVSSKVTDGVETQLYSCVATDPAPATVVPAEGETTDDTTTDTDTDTDGTDGTEDENTDGNG